MLRPNYEKLPHTGTEVESDTEQQSFFNQFLLSFRTGVPQGNNSSTSELVKHAVIRREVHLDVGRVTFQYRCGKLGPEMTLGSILR